MQFTYTYLKAAELSNTIVGKYKGYDVCPTTKAHLIQNGERYDVIYLLYDDNNLLYHNGKVFAKVDKNGNVEEFHERRYQLHERREEKSAFTDKEPAAGGEASTAAEISSSATSTSGNNEVIVDVALGILVEDTLKGARDMTIDSLLEGFNYGLS